jgi:hypothetical protein
MCEHIASLDNRRKLSSIAQNFLQTLGANQVVAHNLGDWLDSIVNVRQTIVMKSQTVLPHPLYIG